MKKKYPDKIEEVEEFYKKEFGNISFVESEDIFNRIQRALPFEKKITSLKNYLKISISINILFFMLSSFFAYKYFSTEESGENSKASNSEELIQNKNNKTKADNSLHEVQSIKAPYLPNANNKNLKKISEDSVTENEPVLINKPTILEDTVSIQHKKEQPLKNEAEPVKNQNIDFYKKHSATKKDSARKLFVPDK
jgi:hypothetical protein